MVIPLALCFGLDVAKLKGLFQRTYFTLLCSSVSEDPTLLVWNTSLFYDDVNACYHAPHMKGGDIILVYGKKVYFIQCSVARYDVLKKNGFMDVAKPGWIAILVTPYDLSKDLHQKKKVSYHKIIWQINSALHALPNSCRIKLLIQFIGQMEIRSVKP